MNRTDDQSGDQAQHAANELRERVAELVGEVAEEDRAAEGRRLRTLLADAARSAAAATGRGVRAAGHGARWGSRWLVGQVLAMAPRLPVRDLATLRAHFPAHSPEQLAETLIEGAARASAAVGAAVGTWSLFPTVPAFPVEIATETLALVGIEIKLVAELHEVYGMRAPGRLADRMTAYVAAWTHRRGVGLDPGGLVLAVGSPLRRRLQRRVAARAGKSALSLGPLLTGAAAGALINRLETRRLGNDIRDDLRQRAPIAARWSG
ncbi:MAG: hypothetical protein ACM3ML_13060 [Micromonosporaceae bacterium]